MTKDFNDILIKYRDASFSQRDKGTRFERLMQGYLQTDPKYSTKLKNVWLWEEFFARREFGQMDLGIDLVAETNSGEFWAIQCKCYEPHERIEKKHLDTFLSTSGRSFHNEKSEQVKFAERIWISTTDNWSSNAEATLHNQIIPITRINISDLQNAPIIWEQLENNIHGKAARKEPHKLKPHQTEAVEKTHEHFKHADRGKLIMACGTGKTFTSLKIAEKESSGFALVLVPSISLVGQILREWTANSETELNTLCICSDPKVTQTKTQVPMDIDMFSVVDLSMPATTDPQRIIQQYNSFKHNGKMTVIFSTYQSIEVINKAQKLGLPEFGIIVCDEAHRTTGVTLAEDYAKGDESAFVRVHNNDFIKAKKRLYMTATPRLYHENAKTKAEENNAVLCSMDDEELYGAEIYRIGFGDAVEKQLLSDYKVLIFTVNENEVSPAFQQAVADARREFGVKKNELEVDTAAKIIGCINALSKQIVGKGCEVLAEVDPYHMRSGVAFCRSIAESKAITKLFNTYSAEYTMTLSEEKRSKIVNVQADHIDGTMATPEREKKLQWLKDNGSKIDGTTEILTNVRCLSEGVDVPSLDAVMFLSARNSQVDVVQSVGRVMRKSQGKKYGYIIIPIVIPANTEPEKALDNNDRYKVVWSVLNALRAHDDRFNAITNSINLNKKRPSTILIGGTERFGGERNVEDDIEQISIGNFEELQNVIYARLVDKVGDRRYWEQWAKSVADIAEHQIEKIKTIIAMNKSSEKLFKEFLREMRVSIAKDITEYRAIEMLAQHIITAPIFDALFKDYAFASNNVVSVAMSKVLEILKQWQFDKDTEELQKFYDYVKRTCKDLDAEGRQKVIVELYNNFFKFAFPKMTEMLGIVYTPVEIVDFIIHSVDDILKQEFGKRLTDENVNILDPFTGTGTFITRLLQSGLIEKKDLPRKYSKELFANELVLLAYYIACVNIENCYHDVIGHKEYKPFDGIALTDTFQAYEENKEITTLLGKNSATVRRQNKAPLTVIFGNPPYSIGQKSGNDDAQNNTYPILDKAIENSYAKESTAVAKRSLYDSYIRAFRYATDRLGNNNGIVCYVSNGAWLDGNSTDGFRKSLEKEFSKIYVFNLRGNQRTSGELSRKEGGKVFGSGSRTPVSIALLVKKKDHKGKAKIHYCDIGDYLTREQKLEIVKNNRSFTRMDLKTLKPHENGDWITDRNNSFKALLPVASDKKFDISTQSFFVVNSTGIITAKDPWMYNASKPSLLNNMNSFVEFYNSQLGKEKPVFDATKISWAGSLLDNQKKGVVIKFESEKVYVAAYRPFNKMHLYTGEKTIHRGGQFDQFFLNQNTVNSVICLNAAGSNKDFSLIMTNLYADFHFAGDTQCFPLYYYEKKDGKGQLDMFNENNGDKYIRHEGISDFIFAQAKQRYGSAVKKEDIFYYVYGLLHSPKYREIFANDLKKSLPRIPLVEKTDDFWAFSKAGRDLAKLHLEYETVPPMESVTVTGNRKNLRVEKMRFPSKNDKSKIIYNGSITIENIPLDAYNYVVNGKSAIEWIMERYQVKTDKDSGITNDPNLYADECGKPSYILDLLLSVITVSIETNKIVASLPELNFES